jgi:GT2 family glycosyltransferase
LRYECKLGFAAACNRGVEATHSDLVFLFNNDAVVEPDAVALLAEALESDPTVGAIQPKILSYANRSHFDYASACGGMLDRLGIPYARGRLIETVDEDLGQFDQPVDVFWGAGAALMIRTSLYLRAGGLEEPFFAHMEEIDLLWRLHLMGSRVRVLPTAVAYHHGAVTIKSGSFRKMYLNHRNSLAMMFRNYGFGSLIRYLPIRMMLDVAWGVFCLIKLDFVKFWAVLRAGGWFWISLPYLISGRRRVQRLRQVSESEILKQLSPFSIAYLYYIRRIRTSSEVIALTTARH